MSIKIKRAFSIFFYSLSTLIAISLFQNCSLQKPSVEDSSAMSVGYVHGGASLTSCSSCHEVQRPDTLVGSKAFDHSAGSAQTGDCVMCHDQPGGLWSSANSKFAHTPIPASCNSCHSTSRPASNVPSSRFATGNNYFHAGGYNGLADCATCHTQQDVSKIGTAWSNGIFNHKTNTNQSVTECSSCHEANRPTMVVGVSNFNHQTSGTGECFACHQSAGATWETTAFSHSPTPISCSSCHNSARPSQTQYFPANPAKPNFNLYVHATVYNGSADCVGCHISNPANIGISWTGGSFNHKSNANLNVTTCNNCHGMENPGLKGSFDHALNGTADCASCHTLPGVSWAGAQAVPATVTLKPPTGSTRPALTIPHPSTSGTNVTCLSCHAATSFKPVIGYDHANLPAGPLCIYCHQTGQSSVTKLTGVSFSTKGNSHEGANLNTVDCNSCHNTSRFKDFSFPSKTTTLPAKWTSGKWK